MQILFLMGAALLQLCFAQPLGGLVMTEAEANSGLDGLPLDADSLAYYGEPAAEGAQDYGKPESPEKVRATGEGLSGQANDEFQAAAEAQADLSESAVGGTQEIGKSPAVSVVEGVQSASGPQAQLSGSSAGGTQYPGAVLAAAGGEQVAVGTQNTQGTQTVGGPQAAGGEQAAAGGPQGTRGEQSVGGAKISEGAQSGGGTQVNIADGAQAPVNGQAAAGGAQTAEGEQTSGGSQVNVQGPTVSGSQTVGKAQASAGVEQAVGGAQSVEGVQTVAGAQSAGGALSGQSSEAARNAGGDQVLGKAQAAERAQTGAGAPMQIIGQAASVTQTSGKVQAVAGAAQGAGETQVPAGESQAAKGAQSAGETQGVVGGPQATGVAQAQFSGSTSSELQVVGKGQSAKGDQVVGGMQAPQGAGKGLVKGGVAGIQASGDSSPFLFLSPVHQLLQGGVKMSGSDFLSSQQGKQSQAQVIDDNMPSNMLFGVPGADLNPESASEGYDVRDGDADAN